MAAAAGKTSTISLSLFMEAYGLEVEEEISIMATEYWAEGVWTGKWSYEQKEAWMRQIREVQQWKQVRGPAGAAMCETRDLGTKWPQWRALMFSHEIKIDMRFVCPKDVKKMLVQRARSVYWKKWAAKHELVRYQSMSSLPDGGGRHRDAQALPVPRMVPSQTGDSRGLQKVGATSKNLKGGV